MTDLKMAQMTCQKDVKIMKYTLIDSFDTNKIIAGYTTDASGHWRNNEPGDHPQYEALAAEFGLTASDMVRVKQRHTDLVRVVSRENGGLGILCDTIALQEAGHKAAGCSADLQQSEDNIYDGMVTSDKGLILAIVTADCVPVFLHDPDHGAIGLIHSGREGCAKEIAVRAVEKMCESYGSNPKDIICHLGPYISSGHHEVQEIDLKGFYEHFTLDECEQIIEAKDNGRYNIDMGAAIRASLVRAGLAAGHIHDDHICTFENKELYSWRRDHDKDARILSFMMLR